MINKLLIDKDYSIRIYSTHIEVFPYMKNDSPKVEKMFSKWDDVTHQYIPIGYYIENNILYLPRGTSLNLLANEFNATPNKISIDYVDRCENIKNKIDMNYKPRDVIQEDSIDFLTSKGRFTKGNYYNQYGLNLDTGAGKTYCMIAAIADLNLKAIVITHKTRLRDQWYLEFINKSNITEDRVVVIDSSNEMNKIMNNELEGDIYLVNHQTLASYARMNSWETLHDFFKKIRVGVKVVDEAHRFFENSLMIDYFSNVKRNYYLTATFTRSDPKEIRIFERAYASLYRFGEETLQYDGVRKHINLICTTFQSRPSIYTVAQIVGGRYGFNTFKYIDYELKHNERNSMLRVIESILIKVNHLKGKILIIAPKIDSLDIIADYIKDCTNKSIGIVHSKKSDEEKEAAMNCDIIIATIKSIGEGDDIKGLRVLINTEPIGSKALADQLRGRLRPYSDTDDTYLFYLVDLGIDYVYQMFKRHRPVFEKKCKEIIMLNMEV